MRKIEWSNSFARDYTRIKAALRYRNLDDLLRALSVLLTSDQPLPYHYQDHPLSGSWSGCRDCHLRPDLSLIYEKFGTNITCFASYGSALTARWRPTALYSIN